MNDAVAEMVNRDVLDDLSISTDFDAYMDIFCAATGDSDMNMI